MRSAILSLCMLTTPLAATAAPETAATPRAPAFDLPLVGDGGYLRSADLFPAYDYTFLVFWESGCPRCVESLRECDAFYEEWGAEDVTVLGIHTGHGDPAVVERLIKTNEIRFQQLWDIGGETAQSYRVQAAAFTVVLVSRDGRILVRGTASEGDMSSMMNEMLSSATAPPAGRSAQPPAAAAPEETSPPWAGGLVFHGDSRLRFLSIDSRGKAPVGPYGEALEPGNTVLYRFDLQASKRITRHLRVGGFVRIGNEDEKVLKIGPEYLGSRWGSAFAEASAGRLFARLGYYEISSTPLTLMRWDWDDNPRVGGNAGCGCGAAAGVLLVESLEELSPELVFEGASAGYRVSDLEARAFYAIPRRANKTRYWESTAENRASYPLELGGAEAAWSRFDARTGSSWQAGLRFIGSWESDRSVDMVKLGYLWPDPSTSSSIVTADWNIPVLRFVDLRGEWMLRNKADENAQACCDTTLTYKGKGGIAGLVLDPPKGWRFRADYIYLSPEFYSPFAALSYAPNREGARVSAEVPLASDRVVVSLFYKRLRETEASYSGADKEHESYFGVSLDAELENGLGGSIGWLDTGTWRAGAVQPLDDVRKALVVDARYRFDKASTIQLQYQRLERTITSRGIALESGADLYSVYTSVRF